MYYNKYRYHLLPIIYFIWLTTMVFTFIVDDTSLKSSYISFKLTILIITTSLILEGFINQSKYKLKYDTWQIKIDPSLFEIFNYINDGLTNDIYTWTSRQATKYYLYDNFFNNEITSYVKKGDNIIAWIYGETIGVYFIGEVIETPRIQKINNDQIMRYLDAEYLELNYAHIQIRIKYNLFNNPISHKICYQEGLSIYSDVLFEGLLNGALPERFNKFPREPPIRYSRKFAFHNYKIGKIDTYSWLPIKPIWTDIWEKVNDIIYSEEWY